MTTPCLQRIDADCFRAQPAWAKRAFAYRLVHLLTPKPLTKRLPKGLRLALIAPGLEIPPGVELPPGVVVSPGTDLPASWTPGDPIPPGVTVDPTATFPPGWSPGDQLPDGVALDPGAEIPAGWQPPDPLPSGALPVPVMPPDAQQSGPIAPTYTGTWGPGPVTRPSPAPTGVVWHIHFTSPKWSNGYKTTWTGTYWRLGPVTGPTWCTLPAIFPAIWQAGYRPPYIRITYTGTRITSFNVRDQGWAKIATPPDAALDSLEERRLFVTAVDDIHTLHLFIASGQTNVTNIEFYPP